MPRLRLFRMTQRHEVYRFFAHNRDNLPEEVKDYAAKEGWLAERPVHEKKDHGVRTILWMYAFFIATGAFITIYAIIRYHTETNQ